MKHLKLPEVFNQKLKLFEGYLDKQPYEKTDDVNYAGFTIPFTEKEISKMKEVYSDMKPDNYFIDKFIHKSLSSGDKGIFIISLHYGSQSKPNYDNVIEYQNYFKFEDDWYYLYHNGRGKGGRWFKCDQFEGLIKCMEDNKMSF